MTPYATPTELAHYMDPDADPVPAPPALATVLLRSASQLVADAIAAKVYAVDSDGLPTVSAQLAAVKDATCEQAQAWSLNGIDPRKGPAQVARRVSSKSAIGISVSYVADPNSDSYLSDLARADSLTSAATTILDNAGMLSNRVGTGGNGTESWNRTQRYYDPLSGDLDG